MFRSHLCRSEIGREAQIDVCKTFNIRISSLHYVMTFCESALRILFGSLLNNFGFSNFKQANLSAIYLYQEHISKKYYRNNVF